MDKAWKIEIPIIGYKATLPSALACLWDVELFLKDNTKEQNFKFNIKTFDEGVFYVSSSDSSALKMLIIDRIAKGQVPKEDLIRLINDLIVELNF